MTPILKTLMIKKQIDEFILSYFSLYRAALSLYM